MKYLYLVKDSQDSLRASFEDRLVAETYAAKLGDCKVVIATEGKFEFSHYETDGRMFFTCKIEKRQ